MSKLLKLFWDFLTTLYILTQITSASKFIIMDMNFCELMFIPELYLKVHGPIFQNQEFCFIWRHSWKKWTYSQEPNQNFPPILLNFPPFLHVFLYFRGTNSTFCIFYLWKEQAKWKAHCREILWFGEKK